MSGRALASKPGKRRLVGAFHLAGHLDLAVGEERERGVLVVLIGCALCIGRAHALGEIHRIELVRVVVRPAEQRTFACDIARARRFRAAARCARCDGALACERLRKTHASSGRRRNARSRSRRGSGDGLLISNIHRSDDGPKVVAPERSRSYTGNVVKLFREFAVASALLAFVTIKRWKHGAFK